MPIKTECQCGAAFAAPDKLAGKKVKCPKCSQPVLVPPAKRAAAIRVACQCGKSLQVPTKFAGKAIKCPGCGQMLSVPGSKPGGSSSAAETASGADLGELFDEVNLKASQTGLRCPNCRQDLAPDSVLCVNCGYNLETGKQLKTKVSEVSQRDPKAAAIAAAKSGKAAAHAPPPVQSLAKLLNQVGTLGVLAAVGFVAYRCYQAFTESTSFTTDQIMEVMSGSAGYVLGAALVLLAVPAAVAANLVQEGKAAGRFLSMAVGVIGLVGLITTLPAILVLKLAFSDEVARYCESG